MSGFRHLFPENTAHKVCMSYIKMVGMEKGKEKNMGRTK
jgi:hypothetical protein